MATPHSIYTGVKRDGVIRLQAVSETKRQAGHGAINVFVSDADALYQELKSRGGRTLTEPKHYPYALCNFHVVDLDGNLLCFGHGIEAQLTSSEACVRGGAGLSDE